MKSWCIGKPPAQYVAEMEDMLDVYRRTYDPHLPRICLDEISKELPDSPRGSLPREPGQAERQDYQYARNGVRNLLGHLLSKSVRFAQSHRDGQWRTHNGHVVPGSDLGDSFGIRRRYPLLICSELQHEFVEASG